jgi:hypothetical protein
VAFYFKEKSMTKKKLESLDTPKSKETRDTKVTESLKPQARTPQRKITPETFAVEEKARENSKMKSGELAEVENHYVNGSFTHSTSNRGK